MSLSNQKKVLFLDRDGVVNVDHGYVSDPNDFEFIDGVFSACHQFQQAGYDIVIITNQSGIGRGYYDETAFIRLTDWMKSEFLRHNVNILDVYFCPHHPTKANPPYLQDCQCRKPQPGMLLNAISEHNINPANSIMVGDKGSDMRAAVAANLGHKFLVTSGQDLSKQDKELADAVYSSLPDLATHFLSELG